MSPVPPVKQNHKGNYGETTGVISSTGDIISQVGGNYNRNYRT